MGFRMIDPVMIYKKKRRPESSKEVLDRIESYLDGDFEEPIRILHNMWEHQENTIGYPELRQIVLDGMIGYEILRTWTEDYSKLVDTHIKSLWTEAMQAGRYGQPVLDKIDFGINFQNQRVQQWIGERGAQLVTNCVDAQIESIKTLMTEKMRQMYTPDHIARMMRPCIGLTVQQTNAVKNHYNTMVGTLQENHPKMKLDTVHRKAEEASLKYAERLHRYRAQTIVQTESAFAYNRGADEAIRQAQEQNLIGACVKRWCTSGDARVCQMCAELDGTEIAMDDDFKIKGKAKFEGMHMLPPAHPRCGCAVEYIEADIKMNPRRNQIEFPSPGEEETQDYREVVTGEEEKLFQRKYGTVTARKIESSRIDMYASNKVKLSRKEMHTIESGIIKSTNALGINNIENLPPVVVVADVEMKTGALASYIPYKNVMYINQMIAVKSVLLDAQRGFASNRNRIATYTHELIHWMDAEEYRKKVGKIDENYAKWLNKKCKNIIEKLEKKGYNIRKVSVYADDSMEIENYFEAYTEYRTQKILGE